MHQIYDWAKYHEFTLYVVTFQPLKIPTLSAPQNDRPEPYFCERYGYQCLYFNCLQSYDLKCKFMIGSPVANLMHHPLYKKGNVENTFKNDILFQNCSDLL